MNRLALRICVIMIMAFMITACSSDDKCPECNLIPNEGICNAAFPRYYFDTDSMKCKIFVWGGCGGVVPFETLEACEACECAE